MWHNQGGLGRWDTAETLPARLVRLFPLTVFGVVTEYQLQMEGRKDPGRKCSHERISKITKISPSLGTKISPAQGRTDLGRCLGRAFEL